MTPTSSGRYRRGRWARLRRRSIIAMGADSRCSPLLPDVGVARPLRAFAAASARRRPSQVVWSVSLNPWQRAAAIPADIERSVDAAQEVELVPVIAAHRVGVVDGPEATSEPAVAQLFRRRSRRSCRLPPHGARAALVERSGRAAVPTHACSADRSRARDSTESARARMERAVRRILRARPVLSMPSAASRWVIVTIRRLPQVDIADAHRVHVLRFFSAAGELAIERAIPPRSTSRSKRSPAQRSQVQYGLCITRPPRTGPV